MKAELKGNTLYIHSSSTDQWTGKTIALRVEDGLLVCGEVKTRAGKRVVLSIRLEGKPELGPAVQAWEAGCQADQDALQAAYDERKAQDAALLLAMEQEATRLRGLIPAGHVEVTASEISRSDGDPIYRYEAEGTEIPPAHQAKGVCHGWASATRPGALASFAAIQVCSISRSDLEEIRNEKNQTEETKREQEKKTAEEIETLFAQARSTGRRVALRTYMVPCDDPREECSWDAITVWVCPDRGKVETRIHTW